MIVAFVSAILIISILFSMVKDSVLLYGSIKQSKGALVGGAIMEGLTLLGLLGIGIDFTYLVFESYSFQGTTSPRDQRITNTILYSIPWMIFPFKLWNFLIIIGAIQEVELKNQREETAVEMSYMAVAQNESQANKDGN